MKYLESAIKFLIKYWILAVPLYILTLIPAWFTHTGSLLEMGSLWSSIGNPSSLTDTSKLISMLPSMMLLFAGGGILSFIFQFVSMPATYGLVNKGLDTGSAGINDIGQAIAQNFVKYVLYFIGNIVVWLVFGIAAFLVILLLGLILGLLGTIGVFLMVLISLAVAAAGIVLAVLLSMWLSAMVVDNLDVVAAAKKSIETAKSVFWTIVGITLLVWIAGAILGAILGLLNVIPVIGPIISSTVPAAVSFVMITFYLMVYREKSGRINAL